MPRRGNFKYTEEQDAELKRRMEAGDSFSTIAREMNLLSRNAAIGRAARLGLVGKRPPRPRTQTSAGKAFANRQRGPRRRIKQLTLAGCLVGGNYAPTPPQPVMDDLSIPIGRKLQIEDLTSTTCHWPHGDPRSDSFFFCGAPKPASDDCPYCGYHMGLAYVPTTRVNTFGVPKA